MSLQEKLLSLLSKTECVDTIKLVEEWKIDYEKIVGAVRSLKMFDDLILVEEKNEVKWVLTNEGKNVLAFGSYEMQLLRQVPPEGIMLSDLLELITDCKLKNIGFPKAMAAGWLLLNKAENDSKVMVKSQPKSDTVQDHLKCILNGNADKVPLQQKEDYKKRKLVADILVSSYIIRKGEKFTTEVPKEENDFTVEMLNNGSWKNLQFKPYNFNTLGTPPPSGHLHPLLKVRAEVRKIFLEMGFKEMPTNNYVESSFWNFDALFQPQQHPARDAHDTFFISDPACSKNFPKEYMERVKKVHSEGGYGSQGYGYAWNVEEASRNLLRTHTTAVSAKMLYQIAQEGFQPAKYFSIDKVFRNESLDATHLAEFHQVEGVIADFNLNLGCLIGTLSTFFKKLGIDKLEFKPAYNPYTEPSMEIFGYHEGLDQMMEVGNSGIFRPEMLLPMGLPVNVTVIAWGLSLERPTMIKYGVNNIRDLVGPKVDLKMVFENPICRLDKGNTTVKDVEALEQRWELIVRRLETLCKEVICLKGQGGECTVPCKIQDALAVNPVKVQMLHRRTEAVVFANYLSPPLSVYFLIKQMNAVCNVVFVQHDHSSIDQSASRQKIIFNIKNEEQNNTPPAYHVSFIWKKDPDSTLVVSPLSHIKISGEVNILRYFCREYEKWANSIPLYEKRGLEDSTLIDMWLDQIHFLLVKPTKKLLSDLIRDIEKCLQHNKWLVGNSLSIADIALWSAVHQCDKLMMCPKIKKWFEDFNPENWVVVDPVVKVV